MSKLWDKSRYSSRIEYILDNIIREFDISKANISVLRDANVLSEEQYQYYLNAPRMERQIAIGKLQGSNTAVSEILKSGITNARRVFLESNNVQDSEVLYIRNDAIAVIGSRWISQLQVSDHVAFRESAHYTAFYKFNTIDMLYLYDAIKNEEHLDLKGLGDEAISLHKDFMIDFLCELFYTAQTRGVEEALQILDNVHSQYINMQMPIGYYREFNSKAGFKLHDDMSMCRYLYLKYATEYDKRYIDIGFNESMLRHFNRIYLSIYFDKIKK